MIFKSKKVTVKGILYFIKLAKKNNRICYCLRLRIRTDSIDGTFNDEESMNDDENSVKKKRKINLV